VNGSQKSKDLTLLADDDSDAVLREALSLLLQALTLLDRSGRFVEAAKVSEAIDTFEIQLAAQRSGSTAIR